jgi:hypothetical protein
MERVHGLSPPVWPHSARQYYVPPACSGWVGWSRVVHLPCGRECEPRPPRVVKDRVELGAWLTADAGIDNQSAHSQHLPAIGMRCTGSPTLGGHRAVASTLSLAGSLPAHSTLAPRIAIPDQTLATFDATGNK